MSESSVAESRLLQDLSRAVQRAARAQKETQEYPSTSMAAGMQRMADRRFPGGDFQQAAPSIADSMSPSAHGRRSSGRSLWFCRLDPSDPLGSHPPVTHATVARWYAFGLRPLCRKC